MKLFPEQNKLLLNLSKKKKNLFILFMYLCVFFVVAFFVFLVLIDT